MKIKFSTVALIVCIAALAANAVLGFTYLQQREEKAPIVSELAFAGDALAEYEGNVTHLEEELAAAETRLAEEQSAAREARTLVEQAYSPDRLSGGGILEGILHLARENGIEILEVSTEPAGDRNTGVLTFTTLYVDLKVASGLPHLAVFMEKLEKGDIKAVSIDEITIDSIGNSYHSAIHFSVLYPRLL